MYKGDRSTVAFPQNPLEISPDPPKKRNWLLGVIKSVSLIGKREAEKKGNH